LPATKIIILSGHDEFKYAQEAIQIGVTEYLLKPIIPQDLLAALRKVARQIDDEQQTSAHLQALQAQMSSQRSMLRERCLLDLVTGNSSAADFIEQAQGLEIDLLAPWYQVLVIHALARPGALATPLAIVCQHVDTIIADIIGDTSTIVSFKQGLEETILILKGEAPEVIEYLKTPPSRALLQRLIARMGVAVREVIRQKDTPFAELGLGDPSLSDDQLLDAMMAHPTLINRPIVVSPRGVKLCRPSEAVLDLLPAQRGEFRKEDGELVIDAAGRPVAA
jgi:arsenate reductase (glutaredoxin)